jgi:hypothetical protein
MSALCALRLRTNEEVVEETDGPETLHPVFSWTSVAIGLWWK